MKKSENEYQDIRQLQKLYRAKKKDIARRLREFSEILDRKNDDEVFCELAFCLLTPQSKARCCWDAIQGINRHDLLLTGSEDDIKRKLHRVRFHNKKAGYLVGARDLFRRAKGFSLTDALQQFPDVRACREWLVQNIRGFGYKEASHFLRNIGLGDEIAILDRHILRNLLKFGVIRKIPASLGRPQYLTIEQSMATFSRKIGIPLAHLDLLLWYMETGELFK